MKKTITRRSFLKKSSKIVAATGLGGCGILLKGCTLKKEFDLIIRGGYIFDGSGGEAYESDIGISGNFIKEIGQILSVRGESVIEAKDLVVCPGFIDTHDHTDVGLLVNPRAESSIRQGVTTLVSGNCGYSPFPVAEEIYEEEKENLQELYQLDLNWKDINGFFSRLEEKGIALNYSTLVGQGAIRGAAMGFNDRPPSQEELEKMKKMVEENMRWGAIGLSSGLEYAPGSYAKADEIHELCKVAAQNGGVYATHMRDEGDQLIESLDETIEAARKTGVSLEISHFYPYIAGSTGLSYYFPLWAKQGTTDEFLARLKDPEQEARLRAHLAEQERKIISWNKVVISSVVSEKNKIFEGKSVQEGAKEAGKKPYDFMKDLLIEERNRVDMVTFMMKEKNLKRILAHPLVGVGSDASAVAPYGLLHRGKPHPRHYGTFPRVLGKYVREDKIVPMPEMLKKMTSVPAQKFGFGKRGTLKSGYFADIVIFDKDKVIDKATWTDPHQYSEGIEYVLVNGRVVIKEGEHTGDLPGKVLRKETV
jgi:N-acyl-D-amino-acid deacylase